MPLLTAEDLPSGLLTLGLWLLIAALIVAISIARARKRGSTTLALDVTRNASYAYVALACAGAVLSAFSILGSTGVSLDGETGRWVMTQEDSVLSPVCGDVAHRAEDMVTVCGGGLENVPFTPRLVIYIGTAFGILASGAIAWAIYTATRRAGLREPFHPSTSRTFGIVAIVVMVSATAGELLRQIGMTLAARTLDWEDGMAPSFALSVPLWPFAVAVGLFALSAIFRYGAVLQRETEGLA